MRGELLYWAHFPEQMCVFWQLVFFSHYLICVKSSPISCCTDGTEHPPQAEERVQSVGWCQCLERMSVRVVGGGRWVWEEKSLCGGSNNRSPTEMLSSIANWKRGRELFTRMKKNVPLLICVQSKNNLPSLSTAHWGRLVKRVCLQRGRVRGLQRAKQKEESRQEGGIKWKMERKWEGGHRVIAKSPKRRLLETDEFSIEWEWIHEAQETT